MNSTARKFLIRIGLIAVIIAVFVSTYLISPSIRRLGQPPSPTPTPTPTLIPLPTPTPIPLAPGKQTYNVSSQGSSIKLTQASFDPLDALVGQEQTINVKVSNTAPIDSVSVTFMGDSAKTEVLLTLASGTAKDGTWSKTWTVNLAHTRIYNAKITVVSSQATDSVDLWFR